MLDPARRVGPGNRAIPRGKQVMSTRTIAPRHAKRRADSYDWLINLRQLRGYQVSALGWIYLAGKGGCTDPLRNIPSPIVRLR